MKRKTCKRVLCMLLAIGTLFLAACGGTATSGSTTGSTSGSTGTAGGTISIMTAMAYGTDELNTVLESFKASHPGIEIDVQHVPNDFDQTIASRFNSGDIPDIFVQQTGSRADQYSEYAYDFTGDPVLEKFNDSAIDVATNAEGRVMGLPWTYESMAFIYNQKIFDEAGITAMPQTLDELVEVCKKIKDAGYTPFATGMKETWVLAHVASHFIATEGSNAKDIVADINNGDLTFATMKDYKNLFTLLDIMTEYGPAKPLEVDWEISENNLVNDQAAIIHMGDWCEATLKEFNPDYQVGFMPVPTSNGDSAPTFLSSISWQFMVNKDSANLEAAKELLEFMLTSDEGIVWMTQGVKALPAAKTDVAPDGMLATAAQEYVSNGTALPWNHTLWPANFNNVMGAELQRYVLGEASADEVMATLQEKW